MRTSSTATPKKFRKLTKAFTRPDCMSWESVSTSEPIRVRIRPPISRS